MSNRLKIKPKVLKPKRVVSPERLKREIWGSLFLGPFRALELARRTPELFRARGWPLHEEGMAIASAAVGCVKIGADLRKLHRPPGAECIPGWAEIRSPATAYEIVEALDLRSLVENPR